ncbi:MAG: mechanosensitive ion channel [Desulfuromonadales bacterium]|nr:mechanosensitive ion channel [Desulfuromonadales bacterium]
MTVQAGMLTLILTRIVYAAVILAVGYWGAKMVVFSVKGIMQRRQVDPTLISFVSNLTKAAIIVFACIAAIHQLGIQTTSLVAVVGAAGLAIGLALKDSLGNFAAGVMILIFRQFRAGDVIEAAGVIGLVESLHIFSTQLKSGDNKTIYIPNGKLIGDNLINYSAKGIRRLDLVYGVSYNADLAEVKRVLEEILASEPRVLSDPEPFIGVLELADNSVNFAVRPWVNNADYWPLLFHLNETVKLRFDQAGIGIPFPQRDVHLYPHEIAGA